MGSTFANARMESFPQNGHRHFIGVVHLVERFTGRCMPVWAEKYSYLVRRLDILH